MMTKELLTIIIPFLNEKDEVFNTVKSIREHSNSCDVIILLINDASDDGFDYKKIAEEFETEYLLNPKRLGVAASRDLGVSYSQTPYVMFLDAHMRFYNSTWVGRVVDELKRDEKSLICCQTKRLMIVDCKLKVIENRSLSFGAYVDFYDKETLLECHWLLEEKRENENLKTINIPCVLGAAYACTREYWLYLKGLEGLIYYGNDESYICMKVWLEGGACKLLKDVVVGHIYRDNPPYIMESAFRLYNRLLIAELLLPEFYKNRIFSIINGIYKNINRDALHIIYQNRRKIFDLKKYYNKILIHEFSYYEKINNQFNTFHSIVVHKDELLRDIAQYVILNNNSSLNDGLLYGRLGIVIFLFHYGRYSVDSVYNQFAERILDDVCERISSETTIGFCDGLAGIGWGIEYLYQNKFVEGDTNEILEEIDGKILRLNIEVMDDLSLNSGLGGVVHYVLARVYTIEKGSKMNPFNSIFVLRLYTKLKNILDSCNKESDSLAIFIRFINYFEGIDTIRQPSIYDIAYLSIPDDYHIENFLSGLDGNAGVGLKLIFEEFK